MHIAFQYIEQARELSLVRRQYDWPRGARSNHVGQGSRLTGKTCQGVRVEDDRSIRFKGGANLLAHGRTDAAARSEDHGISPFICEKMREFDRSIDRPNHDGNAFGSVDRKGVARTCDRHKARASPKGASRRQPRRARGRRPS